MKARIIEWWGQLSERDRRVLVVGGVICFFYLYYAVLYAPLVNAVDESRQQLMEKNATYAWMKKVRPLAHKVKAVDVLDAAHLLTVLSDQLRILAFRHYPYQLQQAGSKEIQLSFEAVPYNTAMTWLSSMSQQYAFSIKQLQVDKTDKPGVVKWLLVMAVT